MGRTKAFIAKNGKDVMLRLPFEKAAALHALLGRQDDDTAGQESNDLLSDVYLQLDDMRDRIVDEDPNLWPDRFMDFFRSAAKRLRRRAALRFVTMESVRY